MKTIRDLFGTDSDVQITSLAIDSRKAVPGSVFFCIPGQTVDGHKFAASAVKNGAVCVVHSAELEAYSDAVVYVRVPDVTAALNTAASEFYGNPSRSMAVYGVTGTNGKTSIACILKDVLDRFTKAGYIGTIANKYNIVHDNSPHTTPDAVTLHSILHEMKKDGLDAVAMEVSSHGLEQHRVDSIDFDVAIFTNLTHEHLDFHKTMENYLRAKAKLFEMLTPDKTAVLNTDDKLSFEYLKNCTKAKVLTYSVCADADYKAENIVLNPQFTSFDLRFGGKTYPVVTNLVAMFNVHNLLAAIAALHNGGAGYPLEEILPCVKSITQVQGRIETVEQGQDFHVIIDYAHTPDGFEKIYQFAEKIRNGHSVISVFGSAGERDFEKRPVLGEISDRYCDKIILTEEDCRSEDPAAIAQAIKQGIKNTECYYEQDRYFAIKKALSLAKSGDVVLILAKANEKFLDRKGHCAEWVGDIDAAKEILRQMKNEQ